MRQCNFKNEVKFDNPRLNKRPGLLYSIFIIVPPPFPLPIFLPSFPVSDTLAIFFLLCHSLMEEPRSFAKTLCYNTHKHTHTHTLLQKFAFPQIVLSRPSFYSLPFYSLCSSNLSSSLYFVLYDIEVVLLVDVLECRLLHAGK